MNFKINIRKVFSRKAICIIFVLFISISFPLSGVMADSCKGGVGCLDCTEPAHSHVPGTQMDMAPHGCQPAEQNSTCGFETSQNPDEFHGIVSSARSYHQAYHNFLCQIQVGKPRYIYLTNPCFVESPHFNFFRLSPLLIRLLVTFYPV
jgi:hypothetical protein